jgi:hypothetical protein
MILFTFFILKVSFICSLACCIRISLLKNLNLAVWAPSQPPSPDSLTGRIFHTPDSDAPDSHTPDSVIPDSDTLAQTYLTQIPWLRHPWLRHKWLRNPWLRHSWLRHPWLRQNWYTGTPDSLTPPCHTSDSLNGTKSVFFHPTFHRRHDKQNSSNWLISGIATGY